MKSVALILSVAAALASTSASAHTGLSRAQVLAEHANAVAADVPQSGELYSGTRFEVTSSRTRDQVRAELRTARERGQLAAGEQYPFVPDDAPAPGKTRADVLAELAAYRVTNPDPITN